MKTGATAVETEQGEDDDEFAEGGEDRGEMEDGELGEDEDEEDEEDEYLEREIEGLSSLVSRRANACELKVGQVEQAIERAIGRRDRLAEKVEQQRRRSEELRKSAEDADAVAGRQEAYLETLIKSVTTLGSMASADRGPRTIRNRTVAEPWNGPLIVSVVFAITLFVIILIVARLGNSW